MSEWNAMNYEAKDTLLRVLRGQAEELLELAADPDRWEAPTACPGWQVRDVVGHLVDVTEGYFTSFDAARGSGATVQTLGLGVMASRLNERALAFRTSSQQEMLQRLRGDYARMMEIVEKLGADEWGGLTVPHTYMGPLPAFFYPVAQLMDYTVHTWDIHQGAGRVRALSGEAADLLTPFMFILWGATAEVAGVEPFEVGVRVYGEHGGDFRISVGESGLSHEEADLSRLPAVLEFDPGSFVLACFGRCDVGTIRGDSELAHRFLNLFFRI